MSGNEEAPGTVGAVRGPENQVGAGFQAMVQRTPAQWIQYGHDHLHEILADALKWQAYVTEQWREEQWMKDDPEEWYSDCFAEARIEARWLVPAIAAMREARSLKDARAKPGPIHQLHATPGWPPVAVPGHPGRYLSHQEAA